MATAIQRRRGTSTQHGSFTGLAGEITIDTTNNTIIVHDGTTAGGHRLAKNSEVVAAATGDITAVVAGSGLSGGADAGSATIALDTSSATFTSGVQSFLGGGAFSGHIIPNADITYDLGSETKQWRDIYVGPGSLYVNGQQVLSDNSGTIQFSADANQNISIVSTGTGDIELTSGGDIQLKTDVVLTANKSISSAGGVKFGSNVNIDSNHINNISTPVADGDAANKGYVDALSFLSVTDAGGDGSLALDNGVITYTGPSASEVRAHFNGGTGIDISTGTIAVDSTVMRTTGNQTLAGNKTFSGNMEITGTLTSSGSALEIADEIILLNAGTGSALDTGFQVDRASSADVFLKWDESEESWAFTNDGTTYQNMLTDSTARALISVTDAGGDGSAAYNSSTGVITYTGPTAAETRAHFSAGGDLSYDSSTGVFSFTNDAGDIESVGAGSGLTGGGTAGAVTLNIGEGNGITVDADEISLDESYAKGLISVTDAGGDGSLAYNSSTGVITYTGPSASETRAHLSAGTGMTFSGGAFATTITQYTDADARGAISVTDAGGDGSVAYNSSTGVITYTGPSAAEVRAHSTGGDGIDYASGVIDVDSTVVRTSGTQTVAGAKTFSDNIIVNGNLTINGTQTTVNTETLTVDDNIIVLNNNASGSPTANAGIEIERGDATNVQLLWDESNDRWAVSTDFVATTFRGAVVGNVTGDITGDVTGDVTGTVSSIANHSTSNLSEGTNQYHTTARARGAISVTDGGGDGALAYNSSTGVITYTGPSAAQVRNHFSGGAGITLSSGVISLTDPDFITGVTAGTGLSGGATSGTATLNVSGLTISEFAGATIQLSTESFADNDTTLMTSAAVQDKILSYGYSTTVGDITNVSAGSGLTGGGASGSVSLALADTSATVGSFGDAGSVSTFTVDAKGRLTASGEVSISIGASQIASGTIASARLPDLTVGDFAGAAIQLSSEAFSDSDTVLMTAKAVADKIEAYGYSTTVGDITNVSAGNGLTGGGSSGSVSIALSDAHVRGLVSGGTGITYNSSTGAISLTDTGYVTGVTAGTGLSGGGTSGTVSLALSLGELTDMTADVVGANDELILLDSGSERKKAINEFKLSQFNNDSGWTSNVGDITGVTAGTHLSGGGSSGSVTLSVSTGAVANGGTSIPTGNDVYDHVTGRISGLTGNVGDITAVVAGSYLTGGASSGSATLNVNATSANTASTVVARDGSGNFSAGVVSATATTARYADLAENYSADAVYDAGTVVVFGGDAEITECSGDEDYRVAGVVSTDPAYLMNSELAGGTPVALCGRVPVKVSGPIGKGELLVTSSIPGRAKGADPESVKSGTIIGKAISENEDGNGVVEALINLQ
jgi:hypothetical protein